MQKLIVNDKTGKNLYTETDQGSPKTNQQTFIIPNDIGLEKYISQFYAAGQISVQEKIEKMKAVLITTLDEKLKTVDKKEEADLYSELTTDKAELEARDVTEKTL